jgi:hypothetical protein
VTASNQDPEKTVAPSPEEEDEAERQPSVSWNPEHLLKAYELAQKHYETDLQLFSVRMSLFLLVQTGLVAAIGSTLTRPAAINYGGAISAFGMLLALAWLLVAFGSYSWLKAWRRHLIKVGGYLNDVIGKCHNNDILFSMVLFDREQRDSRHPNDRQLDIPEFWWHIRPTLVTCCLPLLFMGGWIYIGFKSRWSGF